MKALITGAGGAMGSAIAQELARRGADLALSDISQRRLNEARGELGDLKALVFAWRCDVTEPDECAELVRQAQDAIGTIDVLVNVVGGYKGDLYESVLDISLERFDDAMRRNLRGTFILTQLLGRKMVSAGRGRIVNIASVAGYGATGQADYAAAKAGVMAFTMSCALELAPAVTVNAIAPGVIETSVMERIPQDVKERYARRIPMGRFGHPEDVARCVAFLVSDDAGYVTGEVVNVSGGSADGCE